MKNTITAIYSGIYDKIKQKDSTFFYICKRL